MTTKTTTTKTTAKSKTTTSKTAERAAKILQQQEELKGMPDLLPAVVGPRRMALLGAIAAFREQAAKVSVGAYLIGGAEFLSRAAAAFQDEASYYQWVDSLDDNRLYTVPLTMAEKLTELLGE